MNPASRACAARSPLRASGPSSAIAARPARKSISTPIIPGHSELRAGPLLQAPVLAVDQAAFDQPASDLLRAAQPGLEQISPAAAHPPQAHPGPVTGEDRLPVAGDEFIPPQQFHLEGIVAVHDLTVRQWDLMGALLAARPCKDAPVRTRGRWAGRPGADTAELGAPDDMPTQSGVA